MENNLFFREFNFSDRLDELLQGPEVETKQPPKSFEDFLRDFENRQASNRVYFPIKTQFAKASAVYQGGCFLANELFANASLSVSTDGVFQMTIYIDRPLELPCDDPMVHCLAWAMRNADQFCIDSIDKQRFTLVFQLRLYRVMLFP